LPNSQSIRNNLKVPHKASQGNNITTTTTTTIIVIIFTSIVTVVLALEWAKAIARSSPIWSLLLKADFSQYLGRLIISASVSQPRLL
jgi:hypothetical protein